MTTAREIIDVAMAIIGVTAAGANPDSAQYDFGLGHLNRHQRSLFGDIVGPRLQAKVITGSRRLENGEMAMGGTVAATLTLHPSPKAGDRIGVVDAQMAFGTFPLTLDPGNYLIEGATTSKVLNNNGAGGQWFFRDDKGDWTLEHDWLLDETIYFDAMLERPLIAMLARVLTSAYGEAATMSATLQEEAAEARMLFARRYGRQGRVESPPRQKVG